MSGLRTPKIILGAGNVPRSQIGDSSIDKVARYDTPAQVSAFLSLAYQHGIRALDTARNYSPHAPGSSEARLGAAQAGAQFNIDTKIGGPELAGGTQWVAIGTTSGARQEDLNEAGTSQETSLQQDHGAVSEGQEWGTAEQVHTVGKIRFSVNRSLEELRLPEGVKVDVMYLHQPDRNTPFEVTCRAMDQLWREGKFKRFGLSNYTAEEVEKFVTICKEKGYVAPSVYQGQYNPIVRSGEKELFPVLRKYGIAFYSWSPAAAGTFAGNHRVDQVGGRFDSSTPLGKLYAGFYTRPSVDAAIEEVKSVASQHGLTGHAAALRWTVHHSALDYEKGDALIVGASSLEQLSANLNIIEDGALPAEVAEAVEAVFGHLGDDQTPYHY